MKPEELLRYSLAPFDISFGLKNIFKTPSKSAALADMRKLIWEINRKLISARRFRQIYKHKG